MSNKNIGLPGLGKSEAFIPSKINKEAKKVKKEKGKYKRSGHLQDQILKYNYPKDSKGQLNIFDTLKETTKKEINTIEGVKVTEIVEGIKLSPSENKIIDSLCKLLHNNSQNTKPKLKNYYTGNREPGMVSFANNMNTIAPKLAFTLYELTKEYKGGDTTTGKDVQNVKQILHDLDNKKFLLSYIETTKTKGGGRIENKIEEFKKSKIAQEIQKAFPDAKLVDVQEEE